jgi:alginate O-acetyltransferase complex protein AlgI
MCYVAMFPQLVAGPIVRYNTIALQLAERTHTLAKFTQGVLAFQAGLAKKVLVADVLAPVADQAFASPGLGTLDAWLGLLAYTFQIYFDFSGYSDMAIGLGLMMGFRLPINFEQPYRSVSITDFWRRWHVSLSTFLRDYLYVPLGGNRKGALRTYVNLALTMLLGGLWHGAAWTFLAWGAYQGAWLVVERLAGKRPFYAFAPRPARIAATFVLAMFGWVLFRSEGISAAGGYFASLFGAGDPGPAFALSVRPLHWLVGGIAFLVVWGLPTTQALVHRPRPAWILALQVLFLLALVHLHYEDHVPFLYFQF